MGAGPEEPGGIREAGQGPGSRRANSPPFLAADQIRRNDLRPGLPARTLALLPIRAVVSSRCQTRAMFESLNDPVDVLTAFVDGSMRPIRFRWQGRVVRVRRVTGQWARREGQAVLRYFAVQGAKDDSYELCYDARGPSWVLSRAWTAPG